MRAGHLHSTAKGIRKLREPLWEAAVSLAVALGSSGLVFAGPSPLQASHADQELSPIEVDALHAGASAHPYATLALLYVLQDAPSVEDGSLYLESIPAASLGSLLVQNGDSDGIAKLLGVLLWNPYSASQFFVQVTWSVRGLTSGARAIQFHTQLLGTGGPFQHPPIEPDTTVVLRNGSVCFLAPAVAM